MYRIGKEEIQELEKLFATGKLFRDQSVLKEVSNFEKEWAEKIGTKYSLAVTGGTSAIICALAGLGIGPGDEVIVPAHTFMATATAVLVVGAIPVIAEIDETTTIDPVDMEKKISKHTRAIIPVHMRGFPCDMERIMQVARKYDLKVVEDACQADGGSFKGKRLGAWGDVGAFSFNYYKIISCGEGGAITTDDYDTFERSMMYHDGGAAWRTYTSELKSPVFVGTQLRFSEILGAVMRIQLQRLDGILGDLRKNKKSLMSKIAGHKGVKFTPSNDPEGDCGSVLGLQFESEAKLRAFVSNGVKGLIGIDSGKHVYSQWDSLIEKRVGHHKHMNPYLMEANKGLNIDIKRDSCPRTLDILSRTLYINTNPDWTEQDVEREAANIIQAAEKI